MLRDHSLLPSHAVPRRATMRRWFRESASLVLCLGFLFAGSAASAQEWFQHPFGEQRAYFEDWLGVCTDAGAGPCRLVRASRDVEGRAFDTRMSLHRAPDGWRIEVMDRGMPEANVTQLRFVFDNRDLVIVTDDQFVPGQPATPNLAETITVTDPDLTDDLLARMRAGVVLTISYIPVGTGDGFATIPLRGVTAGLAAIDQIETERTP